MAIDLGGVSFKIDVKAGRSAADVNKVAKALAELTKQSQNYAQNASQSTQSQQQSAQAAQQNAAAQQQSAQATGQASQQTKRLNQNTGQLVATIHSLAAAMGAVAVSNFIRQATLLAGRVEVLDTVLRNTAHTANFAAGEVSLTEARVKTLGITTQATREIMTRFAQNSLELADAVEISRIAQDAAVVAGINSSQAAERMTIAVQRLDTRMLRNLGILVNLRQEYQAYGLATGRVETSLTATEKQQIVLNAVMRQGAALAGNYEAAMEDVFKRFTSLDRKIEEATRTIGENFLPVFGVMVDGFGWLMEVQEESSSTWRVIASTALSAGVAFTGVTATLALLQVVSAGYLRITQQLTVAQTQAAGAAAGQAGATAAQGAAAAAAAASTNWLAVAVRGLNFALASTPFTVGLVAVTTVITAAITLWSSLTAQVQRHKEESEKAVEADVAMKISLREVSEEVTRLGKAENKTAREQSILSAAMSKAIRIVQDKAKADKAHREELESLAHRLNLARGNYEEFNRILKEGQPGAFIFKNAQQELESVENQLNSLQQALRKERAARQEILDNPPKKVIALGPRMGIELDETSPGRLASALEPYTRLIKDLEQKLIPLEIRRDALAETINAQTLRKLDESDKLAETALQLAQRTRNRLENQLVKGMGSTVAETTKMLDDLQRNLTVTYESVETIEKRLEATLTSIDIDINKRVRKARNDLEEGSTELQRRLGELEAERQIRKLAADDTRVSDLQRRDDTLKAFEDLEKLADINLEDARREVRNLRRELDHLERGVDPEVTKSMEETEKRTREAAKTAEFFTEMLEEMGEELTGLNRELELAAEGQQEGIKEQIKLKEEEIERTKELKNLEAARSALSQKLADSKKTSKADFSVTMGDPLGYLEETRKERADLAAQIRDTKDQLIGMETAYSDHIRAIQDLTLRIRQQELTTEQFIAKEGGDDATAEYLGEVQRYIQAAAQATNPKQLERILELAQKKGLKPFLDDIRDAGTNGMDAQQAQMRTAVDQLYENRKQTQLLEEQLRVLQGQFGEASRKVFQAEENARRSVMIGPDGSVIQRYSSNPRVQRAMEQQNYRENRSRFKSGVPSLSPGQRPRVEDYFPTLQQGAASPFPAGFNATSFSGSLKKYADSSNGFFENLVASMQEVEQLFGDQVAKLEQTGNKVAGIVGSMKRREGVARQSLVGQGLLS